MIIIYIRRKLNIKQYAFEKSVINIGEKIDKFYTDSTNFTVNERTILEITSFIFNDIVKPIDIKTSDSIYTAKRLLFRSKGQYANHTAYFG